MRTQWEDSWRAMVKGPTNWRCTKPLKRTETAKRGRGLRQVPALGQPDPMVRHLLIQYGAAGYDTTTITIPGVFVFAWTP